MKYLIFHVIKDILIIYKKDDKQYGNTYLILACFSSLFVIFC